MNALDGLDLRGLDQFRATDLGTLDLAERAAGTPMQVTLDLIDHDPLQPRRSIDDATLEELSLSFRMHGVLEPVSLRSHPERLGRYIVNRGERRVRAARRAGLMTIPAFLDELVDPFAQAAENLHRENLSPFDLATFIAERQKEGHSRAAIARRLNKPRSFITEAACLIDTPPAIRLAVEAGRLGVDVRTLYRLVMATRDRPAEVETLLSGTEPVSRANLAQLLERAPPASGQPAEKRQPSGAGTGPTASAGRTVLVVEHCGRRGSLRLKAQDKDVGEVRFGDGSRSFVPLSDLRPVCWATEDSHERTSRSSP